MITTKKNVIVYTIEIDNEILECPFFDSFELLDLFKKEFEKEGMYKESARMDKGGFSYKQIAKDKYYTTFEIYITTRTKLI